MIKGTFSTVRKPHGLLLSIFHSCDVKLHFQRLRLSKKCLFYLDETIQNMNREWPDGITVIDHHSPFSGVCEGAIENLCATSIASAKSETSILSSGVHPDGVYVPWKRFCLAFKDLRLMDRIINELQYLTWIIGCRQNKSIS